MCRNNTFIVANPAVWLATCFSTRKTMLYNRLRVFISSIIHPFVWIFSLCSKSHCLSCRQLKLQFIHIASVSSVLRSLLRIKNNLADSWFFLQYLDGSILAIKRVKRVAHTSHNSETRHFGEAKVGDPPWQRVGVVWLVECRPDSARGVGSILIQ